MDSVVLGLSAALSVLAIGVSVAGWTRGTAARLVKRVSDAETLAGDTARSFVSFEANARSVLGAVEEERERAVRAQRRASSDRVKVEGANGARRTVTRDEQLTDLRRSAGLL